MEVHKLKESLKVEKLRKEFGGLVAVDDVSFHVNEGEIFGIIGPNGAGKTTIFNLITGLQKATSGNVKYYGTDITNLYPHEIAAIGISRTFQNIRLFKNMSIIDNVLVGRHITMKTNFIDSILRLKKEKEDERKALEYSMEILSKFGLQDKCREYAGSLPYGEQRLLEIARAMAQEPKIIFLDEPAAGMNSTESSNIMNVILSIREMGVTPVLIEHDMKVVMGICERLVVLDHGTLIATGVPEEIRNNSQVIEAYLGKEAEIDA